MYMWVNEGEEGVHVYVWVNEGEEAVHVGE